MKGITFLLLLFPLLNLAQKDLPSRKGQLHFDLGLEYRITPIYPLESFSLGRFNPFTFVDQDQQNSGMGINIGMEYFLGKNLALGFSNTFRYDLIVSGQTEIQPDFGTAPNQYGLLIDYHLYLKYYFKLFGKGDLFLSVGISRMNTNSDFSSKESFFDEEGNLVGSILSIESSSYWANRFELGYSNKRGIIGAGIYMSNSTNYFEETTSFIVPFIKCSIKLGKL